MKKFVKKSPETPEKKWEKTRNKCVFYTLLNKTQIFANPSLQSLPVAQEELLNPCLGLSKSSRIFLVGESSFSDWGSGP